MNSVHSNPLEKNDVPAFAIKCLQVSTSTKMDPLY